jgi:hypothetical protein
MWHFRMETNSKLPLEIPHRHIVVPEAPEDIE